MYNFSMHGNTGGGGRRAEEGRVGDWFWSSHVADGGGPEGLQTPPFFTARGLKLNRIYRAEDTGRGYTGSNNAGFMKCNRRLNQGRATQKHTHPNTPSEQELGEASDAGGGPGPALRPPGIQVKPSTSFFVRRGPQCGA